MMDSRWISDLKARVVRPALIGMGPACYSEAAVSVVIGTAMAETNAARLVQEGGPALSLWQHEPATLHDLWDRWLRLPAQQQIRSRIIEMIPILFDIEKQILFDLRFGAVMCRCRYRMSSHPMPDANDAFGMAEMHKSVFNTSLGAAVASRNVPLFAAAIAA